MSDRRARRALLVQGQIRAEWEAVRTIPRDFKGDVSISGIGRRRVQVIYAPTFESGFSWDIHVLDSEWRVFRSKIHDLTAANFRDGILLLGYEELDAEGVILRAYFDRLRLLTIPIGPLFNDMAGADGTCFHLALFGDLQSEVRFQWWSDPPPQWRPLVADTNEMIKVFLKLHPKELNPSNS